MRRDELIAIIKKCEYRFNRGGYSEWRHSDYDDLRREIRRSTNVVISTNTLKRIFGKIDVDEDYFPQRATIDALRTYGNEGTEEMNFSNESPITVQKPFLKLNVVRLSIGLVIILIAVFTFGYFWQSSDETQAKISIIGMEGELPATVFFEVTLPSTRDSVFIDFGDKSPRKYMATSQRIAHNYLFPDVFRAKLYASKKVVASQDVSISSNSWIALGYHWQRELPDRYYAFPIIKKTKDSVFHISSLQMHKMGLDTTTSFFTRICNYTDIDAEADNFVFETTFKNKPRDGGLYCNSTQFQITGADGVIRFRFVNSGCSFRVLNIVGEKVFEGSKTNLSEFVIQTQNWNTVKLINEDKRVTLFVNDRQIFEDTYEKSLGMLRGLFMEFEGNGYLKKCTLQSLEGETYFQF
ncbi:hypothetical protein [Sphingobacterium corticibacterium]|uniref:Uncharacterized protein n=1 Tax=Sphingobacterium corticibacterium TaxID=2484746 RepID=A0A4V2DC02_9SPHI|nr:hypothetical protein [Sphingobacterium corticibacterium]RZF59778.1 hypothetical protein EWE74_11530 [Sphingobacterium corticibacterium]